jgi:hypothetical protein
MRMLLIIPIAAVLTACGQSQTDIEAKQRAEAIAKYEQLNRERNKRFEDTNNRLFPKGYPDDNKK